MLENYSLFLTATKIKKCAIKQMIITLMNYNVFLNAIRLKKCVIKLLILILLQYNFFLKAKRLKKCVIKQFIDAFLYLIPLLIKYIDSCINVDNNKYNQKFPDFYVMTKWTTNLTTFFP